MSDAPSSPNFEDNMKELEQIVQEMESGDLSLASALAKFERGVQLSRQAQATLADAEQKVKILMRDEDGTEVLAAFDVSGASRSL